MQEILLVRVHTVHLKYSILLALYAVCRSYKYLSLVYSLLMNPYQLTDICITRYSTFAYHFISISRTLVSYSPVTRTLVSQSPVARILVSQSPSIEPCLKNPGFLEPYLQNPGFLEPYLQKPGFLEPFSRVLSPENWFPGALL